MSISLFRMYILRFCHCLNSSLHSRLVQNELQSLYFTRNGAAEPNFKYVEVVRKKDERAKLNGYKCRDCQEVLWNVIPGVSIILLARVKVGIYLNASFYILFSSFLSFVYWGFIQFPKNAVKGFKWKVPWNCQELKDDFFKICSKMKKKKELLLSAEFEINREK